ncbi:hypothetical protein LLH03_14055 [bacterium]|nr:hypothetical protein [bacterium]
MTKADDDTGAEVYRRGWSRLEIVAVLGVAALLLVKVALVLATVVDLFLTGRSIGEGLPLGVWVSGLVNVVVGIAVCVSGVKLVAANHYETVSLQQDAISVSSWRGSTSTVAWDDVTGLYAFAKHRVFVRGVLTLGVAGTSGVLHAGTRKVRLPDLRQWDQMHESIVRRAELVKVREDLWGATYGRRLDGT